MIKQNLWQHEINFSLSSYGFVHFSLFLSHFFLITLRYFNYYYDYICNGITVMRVEINS